MRNRLIRGSLAAAATAAVMAVAGGQANALPIGFQLALTGGPQFDGPRLRLENTSAAADITGFSMTIGDLSFNFDRAGNEQVDADSGAPLTYTLLTPDFPNGALRSDTVEYSFSGFGAGDAFRFRTELDSDTVDDVVDFRTILYNNGAADNALISVAFDTGTETETLDLLLSDRDPADHKVIVKSHSVPEPMSMALFGIGLAGLGLVTRRRFRLAR